ncbi:DUF2255 family protein [Salinactinospora qingdaonensis]|uniref:DUF2255 family protein n=1 Tax=Salinactinospora qingdaonensis TaxID=702744 RepID=A0ABP7GHF3_9ACTN
MSVWTEDELRRIGADRELRVASERPDGTLRPYPTIWDVRSGEAIYIRSAYGVDSGWFRRAKTAGAGRINAERHRARRRVQSRRPGGAW